MFWPNPGVGALRSLRMDGLDRTDRRILHWLQTNVEELTNEEIGERVGVSSTTVGERITNLEERGVIVSYDAQIDYERAGIPHHLLLFCSVPVSRRESVVADLLEHPVVVDVRELLSGTENVHVEVVGTSLDEIRDAVETMEADGVTVERSEVVVDEQRRPFGGLGSREVFE